VNSLRLYPLPTWKEARWLATSFQEWIC